VRLDNIVLINDEFFVKSKITSYEFVGSCDALITDYSSIYYDFTLRDKPVAAIWEDIEDYRRNPGFAVDVDFYMKGAEKIYTVEDFIAFIQRVGNGEDILKDERNKIKTMVNEFEDGESTKRVAEFVIEKAGL
jgi:CDP-glycerol glycerophosphotransferase (TagB/SpsB family)